jgi:glycosyltransferase involved in cell wall biosynthesis
MNSDTPIVSIITPVFKTDLQYVEECIYSVINQTYPKDKIEMIICVDSSNPEYRRKLKYLVDKVKQIDIKLIFNNNPIGLSKSRNRAVDYSKGDWLLILDSDDILEKTAMEDLIRVIDSDTAMVYSDHTRISCNLKKIKYIRKKSLYHSILRKFADNPVYNPIYSSVYISHGELIKKDIFSEIGGYNKEIDETPPLLLRIFENAGIEAIKHVPNILYHYRENKDGIAYQKKNEIIKSDENTFFNFIKRHSDDISKVRYIGRIKPFMAKHFAFYDQKGDIIKMPYINYKDMRLVSI